MRTPSPTIEEIVDEKNEQSCSVISQEELALDIGPDYAEKSEEKSKIKKGEIFNYFQPLLSQLKNFLHSHPKKPVSTAVLPFQPSKVFHDKNGICRLWVTFNDSTQSLFCFICLPFFNEKHTNAFVADIGFSN